MEISWDITNDELFGGSIIWLLFFNHTKRDDCLRWRPDFLGYVKATTQVCLVFLLEEQGLQHVTATYI
jgi:hypothetical protein